MRPVDPRVPQDPCLRNFRVLKQDILGSAGDDQFGAAELVPRQKILCEPAHGTGGHVADRGSFKLSGF